MHFTSKTVAHVVLICLMYYFLWLGIFRNLGMQLTFLFIWAIITVSPGVELPTLIYSEHKTPSLYLKRIVSGVQKLSKYVPTWWILDRHFQTIIPDLLRQHNIHQVTIPPVKYNREILNTDDGGTLALDFVVTQRSNINDLSSLQTSSSSSSSSAAAAAAAVNEKKNKLLSQTVIILYPGITGGSDAKYIQEVVTMLQSAYPHSNFLNIVCLNQRGINCPLTSPKLSNGAYTMDFHLIIQYLLERKNYKYFIGIGYSMGSNLLLKYLGEQGSKMSGVCFGAISISNPLDFLKASHRLGTFFSRNVYSRMLCKSALKVIDRNSDLFKKVECIDYDDVMLSERLVHLDERFTRKLGGYETLEAYLVDASSSRWIENIAVPTMIINARNDPFVDPSVLHRYENENVVLVVTENGGHLGFPEGSNPLKLQNWTHGVVVEFVQSVLTNNLHNA